MAARTTARDAATMESDAARFMAIAHYRRNEPAWRIAVRYRWLYAYG
jgi:hypothetical protein